MKKFRIIKDGNGVYKVQKLTTEWVTEGELFINEKIEEELSEHRSTQFEVVKEFVILEDGTRIQE